MPGIGNAIGIPFKKGAGISWSAYWASLISATVENAAPTNVVLTFPSAKTELVASDFTVTVNSTSVTVNSASWAGAVLTLVINDTIIYGDVIVVTFVVTGGTANVTNNVALDANASAFITAAGLTNETQKAAVNELVIDLKAINATQTNFVNFVTPASSVLRAVYPLLGGTATSQKWNLIDPQDADGSFRIVWGNDHEANHTANGYKPNGTDQYGDTKLSPSVSLTVNNTHLCVAVTDDVIEQKTDIGCAFGGASTGNWTLHTRLLDAPNTDTFYVTAYDGSIPQKPANFSSIGVFIESRLTNVVWSLILNGGKVAYNTATQIKGLPQNTIWLGGSNGSAPASPNYASKNYGFASIGAGITDAAAYLYDAAIYKFMRALDRIAARPTTTLTAGIALSIDDFANLVAFCVTRDKMIGYSRAYGYRMTGFLEESSYDAGEIVNGNAILAMGVEFGTHVSILPERHTWTPAQTWTNLVAAKHNLIISTFDVTPIAFANHDDVCEWDTDMKDYLINNQAYNIVREVETAGHDNYYDGSIQLCSATEITSGDVWATTKGLIDDAFTNNKVLCLLSHAHVNTDPNWQQIIAYVYYKNMSFYKMSELIPSIFT